MSTLLKDRYSPQFYDEFCEIARMVIPQFNDDKFKKDLFNSSWKSMELKERVRHTSHVLHQFLPSEFNEGGKYILRILEEIRNQKITDRGLEYFFLPDYVEAYGIERPDFAMDIMEELTSLSTCEFAIRPLIIADPKRIMKRMLKWSKHSDLHVRRLSSEGSRPRLPWAMAIPAFKKDPSPALPILENLKDDDSEFVRKSIANHLNDISKDNPEIALKIASEWHGHSKERDWVVKHACRTLLKQGHPRAMELFGFGSVQDIDISELTIDTPIVKVGTDLHFHFVLSNKSSDGHAYQVGIWCVLPESKWYSVKEGIFYQRKDLFRQIRSSRKKKATF